MLLHVRCSFHNMTLEKVNFRKSISIYMKAYIWLMWFKNTIICCSRLLSLHLSRRTVNNGSLYLHLFVLPWTEDVLNWTYVTKANDLVWTSAEISRYQVPNSVTYQLLSGASVEQPPILWLFLLQAYQLNLTFFFCTYKITWHICTAPLPFIALFATLPLFKIHYFCFFPISVYMVNVFQDDNFRKAKKVLLSNTRLKIFFYLLEFLYTSIWFMKFYYFLDCIIKQI